MTPARGRAFAGALALTAASAVWTLAGASPASAYVCAFGIDSPGAGSISGAAALHVTGPFVARQGIADRSVEVSFTQAPGVAPAGVTVTGAAVGPTDRFDVPVGPLTRNGRYTVRVRARHAGMAALLNCSNGLGADQRDTERTAEVSFGVSVQALPPANVGARFDAAARRAVVSWEPSTDPDVAGYTVSRVVGGRDPTVVRVAPETHSWTDSSLPGDAATLTYSVEASRNGPDAGTTSLPSPPVSVRLDVPAASTAPTPATTPAAGRSPGTSPPTTLPFILGLPVGGSPPETSIPTGPPDSTPAAADGTSQNPPAQPGDLGGGGSSNGDPAVVGGASDGDGGAPQLAFVAAGVLSTVVAAQVLWLRRQSLRPARTGAQAASDPLEPVEPSEPRPGADPAPADPDAEVFAAPASAAPAGAASQEPVAAGLAAMAAGARPTRRASEVDGGTAGVRPTRGASEVEGRAAGVRPTGGGSEVDGGTAGAWPTGGASEVEGGAAGAWPGSDGGTSGRPAADGRDAGAGPRLAVGQRRVEDDIGTDTDTDTDTETETETTDAHVAATEDTAALGAGGVVADRLHQGRLTGAANGAERDPAGPRPATGATGGAGKGSDGEPVRSLPAMSAPVASVILRPSRDGSGGFEPVGAAEADPPRGEAAQGAVARRRRPLRSPTRSAGRTGLEREPKELPEAVGVRRRRPLRSPSRVPVEPVEAAPGPPAANIEPVAGQRRPLRSPTRVPPEPAANQSPEPAPEPPPSDAVEAPILRRGRPLRSPTRVSPEPATRSSPEAEPDPLPSGAVDTPISRRPLRSPSRVSSEPATSSSPEPEPEPEPDALPSGAVDALISRRPLRSPSRVSSQPVAGLSPEPEPEPSGAVDAPVVRGRQPHRRRPLRSADRVAGAPSEDRPAPAAAATEAVAPRRPLRSGDGAAAEASVADRAPAEAVGADPAPAEVPAALLAASVTPSTADPMPPPRPPGRRRRPLRSPTRSAVAPPADPADDVEAVDPARPRPAAPMPVGGPPGRDVPAPVLLDTAVAPRTVDETEDVRREPADAAATSPRGPELGGAVEAPPGSSPRPERTGIRTEAPLPVKPGIVAPTKAGEAAVEPRGDGWVEAVPLPGRELELAASRPIWEPSADPVPARLPSAADAWLWEPPARLDLEEAAAAPAAASLDERQTWEAMARPRRRRIATPTRSGEPPPWPAAPSPDDGPVAATSNGAGEEAAGRHRAGEGDPPPDKLLLILKPEGRGPG